MKQKEMGLVVEISRPASPVSPPDSPKYHLTPTCEDEIIAFNDTKTNKSNNDGADVLCGNIGRITKNNNNTNNNQPLTK